MNDDRKAQRDFLANEARQLLELWLVASTDYYTCDDTHRGGCLRRLHAAKYALDRVVTVYAWTTSNIYHTAREQLIEQISEESDLLTRIHLDDVLERMPLDAPIAVAA